MKKYFLHYVLVSLLLVFGVSIEAMAQPDLYISEFSLSPNPPVQGKPVSVRIGVYNKGASRSGPYAVHWWAGKNFPEPACSWTVDGSNARGGRILKCAYKGYRSWYGRLETVAVADPYNKVRERNERNNKRSMLIRVLKASQSAAPAPARLCSISGSATGSRREAARDYRISLRGPDNRNNYREGTRFDANYHYRFSGLPQGRYWVSVDTRGDFGWGPEPSWRVVNCRGNVRGIDFQF